jgi:hypothetical protein
MTTEIRYIGMDIHREFVVLTGVNADQDIVLSSKRVSTVELEAWVIQHLTNSDMVVMEAGSDDEEEIVADLRAAYPNAALYGVGTPRNPSNFMAYIGTPINIDTLRHTLLSKLVS